MEEEKVEYPFWTSEHRNISNSVRIVIPFTVISTVLNSSQSPIRGMHSFISSSLCNRRYGIEQHGKNSLLHWRRASGGCTLLTAFRCGECVLNCVACLQVKNDVYMEYFAGHDIKHAVYTHSYDPSHTKLLVAGGPLPYGLKGSYIALW